jgi:dihydrodipicolinate synthase/N-acetylneuraminate lyase
MEDIKNTIPRGNYGVLLTPFDRKGDIDKKALEEEVGFCLNTSLTGLLTCGSTGEFIYMSNEQAKEVHSIVARVVKDKKVLIGGANAANERMVLDYMYFLNDYGYKFALICPPYFYPQRAEDIIRFYYFIALKAPKEMKIILYNIPSCAPLISLDILKELILLENIVGLKDSSGDLIYLAKALNLANGLRPDFSIFVGQDIALLPGLMLGAQGCISALSWILHRPLNGIVSAYDANNIKQAEKLQKAIIPVIAYIDKIQFPENYRVLARAVNVYCGEPQRIYPELEYGKLDIFMENINYILKELRFNTL